MTQNIPTDPQSYRLWWEANTAVPYGYCWCGCGQFAPVAQSSAACYGMVRGEPRRYIRFHRAKKLAAPLPENFSVVCECGCGKLTTVSLRTDVARGERRGQPKRFRSGHNRTYKLTYWQPHRLTNELAYVLGFILADGNIHGNTVTLTQSDATVLQRVKNVLGSDHPTSVKRHGSYLWHAVHIVRADFAGWVKSYGLTENKSLTASLPNIPPAFMGAFLRGYFDGDGWASYSYRGGLTLGFVSGSGILLEQVAAALADAVNRPVRPLYLRDLPAYRLKYHGPEALAVADFLYTDAGELFIGRKRDVVEKYRTRAQAT